MLSIKATWSMLLLLIMLFVKLKPAPWVIFLLDILLPLRPVPFDCETPPVKLKFNEPAPGFENPVEIPDAVPPRT